MSIGQFLFTFPYLRKAYIRAISTYTDIKGKILPTKNRFNIPVGGHDSHFVVLCYPQMPYAFHTISQICTYKGYTLTNKPQNADIVMFFEDETFLKPNKVIQDLAKKNTVVNYFCRDVSKLKIEQVHVSVFGYGLEINPLTFKGEYVKKSDANSLHLEKVLSKPENPHKGFVYQRLINNKVKENFQEMRLYIFADKIVYSYLILRPTNERFGNKHASIKITKPSELISSSEYKNVIRFCKKLGLDYGELDVIRDSDNKKLYIIDANHTPGGPPSNFPKKEIVPRLKILSNAFKQTFAKQS